MNALDVIYRNAKLTRRHIVLPEATDPRIIQAASEAAKTGLAQITLVGDHSDIEAAMEQQGIDNKDDIDIQDPATSGLFPELSALYLEQRAHKGVTPEKAQDATKQPHIFAALMVKAGHADGTLGGAVLTTADIVRTAIQVIGTSPDASTISSFFLMLLDQPHHNNRGLVLFSDSGLVVDPDAAQLAQIAQSSAKSLHALTNITPRVAMLSFSTKGSASHPLVNKVTEATALAKAQSPDLLIDGEMQFDAAFVPEIAEKKTSDGPLKGDANVFIFPNLDAGNIGYKIAQRIGGATAIGPILQGLAQPANDLSRGCSTTDIVHMIAVTAAQVK